MNVVRNWVSDPNCFQSHIAYQLTAGLDSATKQWVYSTGLNGWGTFLLMPEDAKARALRTDMVCWLKYSSTKNQPIGFYHDPVKVLVNTPTTYAVQVNAASVADQGGMFAINGSGTSVRPVQWGVYTLDDWNILQSKDLSWFAGDTMPLQ